MLDNYGLHQLTWNLADQVVSDILVASPMDAEGRGIALSVRENGSAADLTGAAVYLVWTHRQTGKRGTTEFEAVDASAGTFAVYYPAAMCEAAGIVDASVMLSLGDGRYIATRGFLIRVEKVLVDGLEPEGGFTLFVQAIAAYENAAGISTEAAQAANHAAADVLAAMQRGDFDGADGQDGFSPTATVTQTAGYSSAGARPWDSVKLQVKRVVIDSSFASVGITNCAYWFSGFTELVEVSGFENMSGITTATQMFSSCASLETIFATSFTNAVSSGSGMFYGCNNLVGGTDGFVPASTSTGSVCKLGTGGVLTDPNADMRDWCKVYVYSDGYVEFTAAGSADAQKTLLASGRLCVNAKYKAAGIIPGYSYRAQFRTVVFRSDMGTFSEINMNYWFYSLTAITSFVGIGNLANVHEMQFAFSSCQGVTELDFTGFDPSHLTNLYYCFGGCNALTTIYADSTWALPSSGVSGTQVFYNCQNLVGENGTVWASSNVGYSYFRINRAGQAGYLTAA